jgi:hypothetical protein
MTNKNSRYINKLNNNFVYSKLCKVMFFTFFVLLAILTQGFITIANNQKDKEVLVKLTELHQYYFKNPNYSVELKHVLFSSNNATDVIDESFNGYYKTNGKLEQSHLMGVFTIQNNDLRLVLDTQSKVITISDPVKIEPFNINGIQNSLKLCDSYSIFKTDSIEQILMEFNPKKNPLNKLVISIKNNRITRLDMYHTETIENSKDEQILPHTRIEFTNYIEKYKIKATELNFNEFLKQKNNKISVADKYKNYKLHDLRNFNKK